MQFFSLQFTDFLNSFLDLLRIYVSKLKEKSVLQTYVKKTS